MSDQPSNNSINQRPVRNLQNKLSHSIDNRNDFLNASNSSAESDSDSESQRSCRIVVPKYHRKKDPSTLLLEQLVAQQQAFLKSQRKVYKLKGEIDTNEVRERYLKLDLNNAQVEVEELKEKKKNTEKNMFYARVENWVVRLTLLAYIFFTIINTLS